MGAGMGLWGAQTLRHWQFLHPAPRGQEPEVETGRGQDTKHLANPSARILWSAFPKLTFRVHLVAHHVFMGIFNKG